MPHRGRQSHARIAWCSPIAALDATGRVGKTARAMKRSRFGYRIEEHFPGNGKYPFGAYWEMYTDRDIEALSMLASGTRVNRELK